MGHSRQNAYQIRDLRTGRDCKARWPVIQRSDFFFYKQAICISDYSLYLATQWIILPNSGGYSWDSIRGEMYITVKQHQEEE